MHSQATLFAGLIIGAVGISACANDTDKMAAANVPQPTSYEGKPGQLICHHIVHEGELTATQECHTQAGWDRLRHEYTLRTMDQIQRNALTGNNR